MSLRGENDYRSSPNNKNTENEQNVKKSLEHLMEIILLMGNVRNEKEKLQRLFDMQYKKALEKYILNVTNLVHSYGETNLFRTPIGGGIFGSTTMNIIKNLQKYSGYIIKFIDMKKTNQKEFIQLNNNFYLEINRFTHNIADRLAKKLYVPEKTLIPVQQTIPTKSLVLTNPSSRVTFSANTQFPTSPAKRLDELPLRTINKGNQTFIDKNEIISRFKACIDKNLTGGKSKSKKVKKSTNQNSKKQNTKKPKTTNVSK